MAVWPTLRRALGVGDRHDDCLSYDFNYNALIITPRTRPMKKELSILAAMGLL